jgi:hypothetical protein
MNLSLAEVFRTFNCRLCGKLGSICSFCDRGQVYCTRSCAKEARRAQVRRASKCYQETPAGRQNHRDRQVPYRKRKRQKDFSETVTHHSSHSVELSAPSPDNNAGTTVTAVVSLYICCICGKQGSAYSRTGTCLSIKGDRNSYRQGDTSRDNSTLHRGKMAGRYYRNTLWNTS